MRGVVRAVRDRLNSAHAIAMVALVVGLAGGAYAASGGIPGPGGVISGCFNKKTGQLRVVKASRHCSRSERRLRWNQKGSKGAAGLRGPQGAPGVNGTRGQTGATGPAGPVTGTLPSGVTLRGDWAVRLANSTAAQRIQTAISWGFSLPSPPTAHFIPLGTTPPAGCTGGTVSAPTADPGNLCVYEQFADNITGGTQTTFNATGTDGVADPFGAGLAANATAGAPTDTRWRGSWAVTAP